MLAVAVGDDEVAAVVAAAAAVVAACTHTHKKCMYQVQREVETGS